MLIFAIRRGYLVLDRVLIRSFGTFAICGVLLALALWLTSHFAYVWFAPVQHFRDELILLLLIAVGAFVYAFLILALFGRGWLFALRRV